MPVISASLFARFASRQENSPTMQAVAALRGQFGGHQVLTTAEGEALRAGAQAAAAGTAKPATRAAKTAAKAAAGSGRKAAGSSSGTGSTRKGATKR